MDNATRIISYLFSQWDSRFGNIELTRFGPSIDQTLIATLVFLLLTVVLLTIFRKLRDRTKKLGEREEFTLKLRNLTLFSSTELSDFLLLLLRLVRALALLFLFFCYVTLITGFFPATRGLATAGLRWLFNNLTSLGYFLWSSLPGLIAIVLIALLTSQALKLVHIVMGAIERGRFSMPGFHRDWANPTDKLISFLLIALAVVLGAPFLPGFDTPAFRGISVFFGVLLSLGSTAAIANVVAGVALIYMRACRPGDRVKIGEIEGIVLETGLLVTRVRTAENQVITLPNGLVLGQPVINLSTLAKEEGAGMNVDLTLGYDLDWRLVHRLLLAAAEKTEGISKKPAPHVLQRDLGDFSVAYRLQAFTNNAARLPLTHSALCANVLDVFAEAGVEILSPVYEANRDGSNTVLPKAAPPPEPVLPAPAKI